MSILDKISEDARRLRVARKLPPEGEPIPDELLLLVIQDFDNFLKVTGLSLNDASRRLGPGYSQATLSTFRNCKYSQQFVGDLQRIARGVNQFMEAYAQQQLAPRKMEFVETEVARLMLNVIRETVKQRVIGMITSDSGRGKTVVMKAASEIYPGATYVRVLDRSRTSVQVLALLAAQLNLSRQQHRSLEVELAVIRTLKGTDRALFIDEAQRLNKDALELIRDIHDECEVPIILGGTRDIEKMTDDHDFFFGQFASRIALRYDVNEHVRMGGDGGPVKPIHAVAEIKTLFASDQIRFTDDGLAALARLANIEGFGGLRLCWQVVRIASTAASTRGQMLDARVLLAVVRELHGQTRARRRIERAMEDVKVVAAAA